MCQIFSCSHFRLISPEKENEKKHSQKFFECESLCAFKSECFSIFFLSGASKIQWKTEKLLNSDWPIHVFNASSEKLWIVHELHVCIKTRMSQSLCMLNSFAVGFAAGQQFWQQFLWWTHFPTKFTDCCAVVLFTVWFCAHSAMWTVDRQNCTFANGFVGQRHFCRQFCRLWNSA